MSWLTRSYTGTSYRRSFGRTVRFKCSGFAIGAEKTIQIPSSSVHQVARNRSDKLVSTTRLQHPFKPHNLFMDKIGFFRLQNITQLLYFSYYPANSDLYNDSGICLELDYLVRMSISVTHHPPLRIPGRLAQIYSLKETYKVFLVMLLLATPSFRGSPTRGLSLLEIDDSLEEYTEARSLFCRRISRFFCTR